MDSNESAIRIVTCTCLQFFSVSRAAKNCADFLSPACLAPSLPRSLAPSLPRSLAPSLPRSRCKQGCVADVLHSCIGNWGWNL